MKNALRLSVPVLFSILAFGASTPFASAAMLNPFTSTELTTNWVGDRTFPTGGVTSVTAFSRTDVARIGINSSSTATGGFYRTEGIKTEGVDNFGTAAQVDLYIDPAWQNNAVRAGFWVVGGTESTLTANYGVVEFVNSEDCAEGQCSTHISNRPDYEGFRIYNGATGDWTNVSTAFEYGKWVTFGIELDTVAGQYIYTINGEEVGTAPGGGSFIRELFLNSYNYGKDNFPNLNSDSYAAHWHVGLVPPTNKDQCKKDGWKTFNNPTFKNQGACEKFLKQGKAHGDLQLSGPSQKIKFEAKDNGGVDPFHCTPSLLAELYADVA